MENSGNEVEDESSLNADAAPAVKGMNIEKNWTVQAAWRFLDLIEERKRRIVETGSLESLTKLRYEDWHPMAKKLQSEGFMYTAASCQKKYINLKKSYFNNKRIVETKRAKAAKSSKATKEPIRICWPFYFRFGALLDEPAETDVVIKAAGREGKRKRNESDEEDSDEDDGEGDDDDEGESEPRTRPSNSKKRRTSSNSKTSYNLQVSAAIHTLLKSEPVIILDDCGGNAEEEVENEFALELVSESPDKNTIKQEPLSTENDEDSDQSALMRRLRRRKLQVGSTTTSPTIENLLPSKRTRKSRVRYSPDPEESPVSHVKTLPALAPTPKLKTFSLSSTTSDEVVTEIRHLRSDISRVNQNLENLVTSHNQLITNFDKLLKFLTKRFK